MLVVAIYLVVTPIVASPDERVVIAIGFAIGSILLAIPIFFFFVWDRLRPRVFDKISGMFNRWAGSIGGLGQLVGWVNCMQQ